MCNNYLVAGMRFGYPFRYNQIVYRWVVMETGGQEGADEDDRLLIHEPDLSTFEEDRFEHQAHVETLEEIIADVEPSWHIGLFGEWGAGKSTIIELLYERIRDSNSSMAYESDIPESDEDFTGTLCVKTDAWKHAENSIRTELVLDLNQHIATELEDIIGDAAYPEDTRRDPSQRPESDEDRSFVDSVTEVVGSGEETTNAHEYTDPGPDGILKSQEIIRNLHDAEEKQDKTRRSLAEIVGDAGPSETVLGGAAILGIFVLAVLHSTDRLQLGTAGLISFLLGTGIAASVGAVVIQEIRDARYEIDRTVSNPRKEWSGAYERLFEDIVATAKHRYAHETGEPLDRIVITVDDVDRCESETAYEILIALKSFLDQDDCIFIIPCDEDALYKHLEGVNEGAYLGNTVNQQHFLSKFFETELEIPEPTQSQLETFAEDQRQHVEDDVPQYVLDVLLEADLSTPRRIIRALNRYVTLRHLALHRQNSSISVDNDTDAKFLAKVSILQEDFPHFHAALERDASQLAEVYQEWESGLQETEHPGTDPLFDDMGIPVERREALINYLSATRQVTVEDPQPFFTLSGSPQQFESRFAERFQQQRLPALRTLLDDIEADDELSEENLQNVVRYMEEQLRNTATRYDAFETVLKLTDSLDGDHRTTIAAVVHEVVLESDVSNLMEGIEFEDFEAVLEELDPDTEMPDILTAYVASIIDTETGVDRASFASLIRSDQVKDVLENEGIQSEFAWRLIDAYHGGELSRAEYDQILTALKTDCTPLYTPELVEAR